MGSGQSLLYERKATGGDAMFITGGEDGTLCTAGIVMVVEQGRDRKQCLICWLQPRVGNHVGIFSDIVSQPLTIEADVMHARAHDCQPGSEWVGFMQLLVSCPIRHWPRAASRKKILSLAVLWVSTADKRFQMLAWCLCQRVQLQLDEHNPCIAIAWAWA